jgi:hypothetical protein
LTDLADGARISYELVTGRNGKVSWYVRTSAAQNRSVEFRNRVEPG